MRLRLFPTTASLNSLVTHKDKQVAFVLATNDFFMFDVSSSAADDGVDTFKPDNILSTNPGRWLRKKLTVEDITGLVVGTDVQAWDTDLDWVAANITAAGKAILDDANAAAQRTTLGAETAGAAAAAQAAAIVQAAIDATTKADAAEADAIAAAAIDATTKADAAAAASQPVDADLTALAALTTTAFGRSVLEAADAAGLQASLFAAGATVPSGQVLKLGNAAVTGLVAGALAALTTSSIQISDSAGQVYEIPCKAVP